MYLFIIFMTLNIFMHSADTPSLKQKAQEHCELLKDLYSNESINVNDIEKIQEYKKALSTKNLYEWQKADTCSITIDFLFKACDQIANKALSEKKKIKMGKYAHISLTQDAYRDQINTIIESLLFFEDDINKVKKLYGEILDKNVLSKIKNKKN